MIIWIIVAVLVILWLLGFLGSSYSPRIPRTGGFIHTLLIIALILIVLKLLGVI